MWLVPADLVPFASIPGPKAQAMIDDAEALALLEAPCLGEVDDQGVSVLTSDQVAQVKALLRGAVLRWYEAGSGASQTQQAGPFMNTVDTRTPRRGMFTKMEVEQLRDVCGGAGSGLAFSVNMEGPDVGVRAPDGGRWVDTVTWVP